MHSQPFLEEEKVLSIKDDIKVHVNVYNDETWRRQKKRKKNNPIENQTCMSTIIIGVLKCVCLSGCWTHTMFLRWCNTFIRIYRWLFNCCLDVRQFCSFVKWTMATVLEANKISKTFCWACKKILHQNSKCEIKLHGFSGFLVVQSKQPHILQHLPNRIWMCIDFVWTIKRDNSLN